MSRYTIKVNGDEASVHSTLPNLSGDILEIQGLRPKFCKWKDRFLTQNKVKIEGPIYIKEGDIICPDIDDQEFLDGLNAIAINIFPGFRATSASLSSVRNSVKGIYENIFKNGLIKLPFLAYWDLSFDTYFWMYENGAGYTVIRNDARLQYKSAITYYPNTDTFGDSDYITNGVIAKTGNDYPLTIYPNRIVIPSSTENSKKKFAISVNDSGEITATEVTK